MAAKLNLEIQKMRQMLSSTLPNPSQDLYPIIPSLIEKDSPVTIPDNSFIKKWRSGDKIFESKYPYPINYPPHTPSPTVMPNVETPPTVRRKYQYDVSDSDDMYLSSKREVSRYASDYIELQQIGSGSFGRVFKCRNKLDKLDYAVKKIPIKNKSDLARERTMQEALTLAQSSYLDDNSYIIKYYSAWIERSYLYLIMELCDCSLPEYIERIGRIDENTLKKIFRDLCKGLCKLHAQNIVHLDIKPDNVLFSFNHKFKIADLGLARITTDLCGEIPEGDARYLAPELMKIAGLDAEGVPDLTKADIFSLGCTMLEIMNREPLPNNGPLWHSIRNGDFRINGLYSSQIVGVVKDMLSRNPTNRPSAQEILQRILLSPTQTKLREAQSYIEELEARLAKISETTLPNKRKRSL